ncbi:MAG: hypothetical protein ACLR76_01355 [Alistipes sp.]
MENRAGGRRADRTGTRCRQIRRIQNRSSRRPLDLYGSDGATTELDRNDFTLTLGGRRIRLEYALILIHGTPGEDGRLQGYLDMMRIRTRPAASLRRSSRSTRRPANAPCTERA